MEGNTKQHNAERANAFANTWERIEEECSLIKDLRRTIEQIENTENIESDTVIEMLKGIRVKVERSVEPEQLTKILELIELQKTLSQNRDKMDFDLFYRIADIQQNMTEKENFVYIMIKMIENLIQNHLKINSFKNPDGSVDIEKMKNEAQKYRGTLTGEPQIKRVIIKPFSINLIYTIDELRKDTNLGDSFGIFNFVLDREDTNEMEDTIRHENLHSLIEKSLPEIKVKHSGIGNYTVQAIIKGDRSFDISIEDLSARDIFDINHEEVIAALSSKGSDYFFRNDVDLSDEILYQSESPKQKEAILAKILAHLSTAGFNLGEMLELLSDKKKTKNSKTRNNSTEKKIALGATLKNMILKSFRIYGLAKRISEQIGGEAKEDLEALIIIFKPSQFHHILDFFYRKYGNERIEEIIGDIETKYLFSLAHSEEAEE